MYPLLVTVTLTTDLIFRIIISGAYFLGQKKNMSVGRQTFFLKKTFLYGKSMKILKTD